MTAKILPEPNQQLILEDEGMGEWEQRCGEYEFDEVASAIQKSIRRGEEEDALFWCIVMEQSGYPWYMWKRLRIIALEDCADPNLLTLVDSCAALFRDLYEERKRKGGRGGLETRLALAAAVIALARAPKSRLNDNACMVMYERYLNGERKEIPDYALDKHTKRGRQMGRTEMDFVTTGSVLMNEDTSIEDPYKKEYEDGVRAKHAAKKSKKDLGLEKE